MSRTRPQQPRREYTRSARLTVVGGLLTTLVGLLGVTVSTAAIHLGDADHVPTAQLAGEDAVAGFDLAVISLGTAGVRDAGLHDAGVHDAGLRDVVNVVRRTRPDVVVLRGIDAHRLQVLREELPGFGFWPETASAQADRPQFAWRLSAFDPVASGLAGGGAGQTAQTPAWVQMEQRSTRRSVFVVSGDPVASADRSAGDGWTSAQDRPGRAVWVVSPTDGSAAARERVVGRGALSLQQTDARGLQSSGLQVRTVRVALAPRRD